MVGALGRRGALVSFGTRRSGSVPCSIQGRLSLVEVGVWSACLAGFRVWVACLVKLRVWGASLDGFSVRSEGFVNCVSCAFGQSS